MTVYRGMDLGTAKPTHAERSEVSYHLLDLVEPSEEFTVAEYQKAARAAAADVWRARNKILYVGGTGLNGRARNCRRSTPNSRGSIHWRRVEWRRRMRAASCARSKSPSARVGHSRPTGRASSPTVRRASLKSRCRVTSNSWTFALPIAFGRGWNRDCSMK